MRGDHDLSSYYLAKLKTISPSYPHIQSMKIIIRMYLFQGNFHFNITLSKLRMVTFQRRDYY